ncbi:helix-hairpin-helix domain-containing protein [Microbacterium sp. P01]|uniref:helix-hairpin-helix domain-containing protein n=1 Tax=Microbacterium sp. P01 TaxID=3366261 RepID=UPI0036708875
MTSVLEAAAASRPRRLGVGAAIVVVLLALAVTVGIGVLRGAMAPTESVTPGAVIDEGDGGAAASAAPLYVHVFGAVVDPGLYVLDDGARVIDVIAAAGGFTDAADPTGVNLARPVSDGEQLAVPALGDQPAAGAAGEGEASGAIATDGRVNLNTADEAALDTLPRIGPAMARRILEWRETNGRFTSVEDLLAVPGIGDKMLESLRELVTV